MAFVYWAERAYPIGGQVLELGAGSDAVLRVTLCGVILIPAYIANILFHVFLFLKVNNSAAKIRLFSYMAKIFCKRFCRWAANGKVRDKTGGGSASHNGIKSIDAAVGNEYRRIRIGISHPGDFGNPMDPADWVLGKFTDNQLVEIKKAIDGIKLI